jgi:hypothetical protein
MVTNVLKQDEMPVGTLAKEPPFGGMESRKNKINRKKIR